MHARVSGRGPFPGSQGPAALLSCCAPSCQVTGGPLEAFPFLFTFSVIVVAGIRFVCSAWGPWRWWGCWRPMEGAQNTELSCGRPLPGLRWGSRPVPRRPHQRSCQTQSRCVRTEEHISAPTSERPPGAQDLRRGSGKACSFRCWFSVPLETDMGRDFIYLGRGIVLGIF